MNKKLYNIKLSQHIEIDDRDDGDDRDDRDY